MSLISRIAVLITVLVPVGIASVFLLSSIYLFQIETKFGFALTSYVELKDYVQTIPTLMLTVAGAVVPFSFVGLAVIVIGGVFLLNQLYRFAADILIALFCVAYFVAITWTAWHYGDTLKQTVSKMTPSTILRNNGLSPIKGTVFLHTGRYIFLWMKDDDSLAVVPQTEVQMIQARSDPSLVSGAASVSPPLITHSLIKPETLSPVPK